MTEAARPGARRGFWAEILALALAYYGVGRLAWMLVPVPGQAVALWPSAGIAVGVLLLRGLVVLPGVTLGAAALALQAILMARALPLPRAVTVALLQGVGATLGPLLATLSVRRFVELPLRTPRHAFTFAALAGPAPAAISALACNAVLFWAGRIDRSSLALSIGVWWIGEALGAIVFAPLVILLGAPGARIPSRQRLLVVLPVLATTALSVWVFLRASQWDRQRAEAVLQQRTDGVSAAVQRAVTYHLDTLRSMADFAGSDPSIDPPAFQRIATGAVVRHFAFEALAWAPATVDRRPVILTAVEPAAAQPGLAVGQDLAADPAEAARLSQARRDGQVLSLPTPGDGKRVWIFVPAPGRNGEQGIQGFLGVALRIDLMIDRAVTELGANGIALELREAAPGGRPLVRTPTGAGPAPLVPLRDGTTSLLIADRAFVLEPFVSRALLQGQQSLEVWIVLLAGMLFVALLEGVLLVLAGRSAPALVLDDVTFDEARASWAVRH